MNTVYSDSAVAVIIKPAGMQSQSTPKGDGVPDILAREYGCSVFPVHRLDFATAGLMVYAKSSAAAAALSRQITEGIFKKEYIAVVHGVPTPPVGEYTDLLYHDKNKNKSYVVKRERRGVRSASLTYDMLKTGETALGTLSAVRIRLKTGRTHQIRVQFASRSMPLVGDSRYGAADGEKRLALFSTFLSFSHPSTGKTMSFEEDFSDLWERLFSADSDK